MNYDKNAPHFDNEEKVAVIYSAAENNFYLVEIHYHSASYFLSDHSNPTTFKNICHAKEAAIKAGACKGYQAVENLYHDIGSVNSSERFEFIPFPLQ